MKRHAIKSRFLAIFGCALCLAAMLSLLGGHWLVLQSVAWARMIVLYSQHQSLGRAIATTFDGQHPCELCLTIQNGRQEEQAKNKNLPCATPDKTPELLCDVRRTVVPPPSEAVTEAVHTVPLCHSEFVPSPPKPPPRSA